MKLPYVKPSLTSEEISRDFRKAYIFGYLDGKSGEVNKFQNDLIKIILVKSNLFKDPIILLYSGPDFESMTESNLSTVDKEAYAAFYIQVKTRCPVGFSVFEGYVKDHIDVGQFRNINKQEMDMLNKELSPIKLKQNQI